MDQKTPLLTDGNGQPNAPPPVPGGQGGYGGVVTQQPYVPPYGGNAHVDVKPPNYKILNVLAMLCCLLCGLMGLYMGSQSDIAWSNGDRELALRHSQNAKKWGIGGIVGGIIFNVCTLSIGVGLTLGLSLDYQ